MITVAFAYCLICKNLVWDSHKLHQLSLVLPQKDSMGVLVAVNVSDLVVVRHYFMQGWGGASTTVYKYARDRE